MWAVLKQLLSTNWLNKSAVKREVSLVSCRNFGFVLLRQKGVTWRMFRQVWIVCRQMAWESPFLVCFCSSLLFWWKGISLTTWMVVGETDKWNINFKFFLPFFLLFTILNGNCVWNGILLFWRKQIIPFVLIVFFGICFCDEDLYLSKRLVGVCPSVMRCHKNRDVRSLGKD